MSETLTSIQAYVIKTKRKLKTWETNFQLKHNRSPTLDDIKSRVTIEKEYQEYQRQKNLLVKKHRQIIQADLTHRLLQNKQSTVQQEGTGQDELPDWEEYRQAIHSFHQLYKSSNTIILNEQSENAGEDHTIETRIINFTCTEKEAQLIESLTMQSLSEKLPVILYEIVQWIFYFQKNHNRYPNCDDILSDRYIIKAFKKYEILMDTALKFLEKEYDGITIPSMFKHSKTTRKPLSSRSSCSSQVDLTTETKKETILKDRHPMTSIEGKEGLTEDFDSFDSKDLTIKRAGRSPTECSTYSLESGVSKTPPGRAKREREECTVTPDDRSNKVKRLFLERQESVCSTSADDFEELKDILKGQKKSRVADDRAFWLGIDVQLPPDQPNHDSVNGDDFPHSEKMVFDSHSPDKKSQLNGHSSPSNPEMSALKSNKDGANGQNSMDKKEEPIQTYNGERVAKVLRYDIFGQPVYDESTGIIPPRRQEELKTRVSNLDIGIGPRYVPTYLQRQRTNDSDKFYTDDSYRTNPSDDEEEGYTIAEYAPYTEEESERVQQKYKQLMEDMENGLIPTPTIEEEEEIMSKSKENDPNGSLRESQDFSVASEGTQQESSQEITHRPKPKRNNLRKSKPLLSAPMRKRLFYRRK